MGRTVKPVSRIESRIVTTESVKRSRKDTRIHRQQGRQSGHPKTAIRRFLAKIPLLWKIVAIVLTVFAVPNTAIFFWPRVSIVSSQMIDPEMPFANPFLLTNEGNFSIYHVATSCELSHVQTKNHVIVQDLVPLNPDTIPEMRRHESESIYARFPFRPPMKIQSADINIDVSFSLSFWPFRKLETFRFTTIANTKGELYWTRRLTPPTEH